MPAGHVILCGPAAAVSNLEDALSSMPPLSVFVVLKCYAYT